MTHNHDISIEIVQKFASLCFESFGKPHERSKHCILLTTPITAAQQAIFALVHNLAQYVGKVHQQDSRYNGWDPANRMQCALQSRVQ